MGVRPGYVCPPGYKQTEVGVIPEDWEVSKLGTHATFRTGPFGSALHQSDYVDGGVPVINPMQIIDGKIQPMPSMAITEQAARKLSEFRLLAGNIVIGRRGEMGRCAFVRTEEHGWLCGTGSMIIRTGPALDARFIRRVLSSPPIIAEIENTSVGSTMINLNQGTLRNLLVALPPTKAEQEAIAEALSDADAFIESLEQLLAKKYQLKQGAMQELLTGKKRLPGFGGEWEVKRLGDVIEKFVGGGTPSRANPKYWGNEIPWVTVKDFATFNPGQSQESITRAGLQNSASHLIPKGTLITSTRMALGKAVVYEVDVAINQDLKALSPKSDLAMQYLYFWFQYHGQSIDELGSGSTVKGISLPDLKKIEFQLPLRHEQTAIAAILSDMDAEVSALEAKLAKARDLKHGMMQELLTGRIRLV